MTTANPYAAPTAADMAAAGASYDPKIFSLTGRIGRLRYLAYGMAWSMAIVLAAVLLIVVMSAVLPDAGAGVFLVMTLMYIGMLVPTFAMAVRRLNDLNQSGWLSLIMLVPLANIALGLYMLFAPGTSGVNKYGPAPGPNSTLTIVAALILPLIAIVGILAAVAIPAYQEYVMRVQIEAME